MQIIRYVLLMLGGITFFILGLKYMSENMERLAGQKMQKVLASFTKNELSGVLTGAISTAVMQSSIATNVILIGFVSSGMLTFYSASAVIMGANIGTTITAQLVALSGSGFFDVTAFGSLVAFVGLLLSFLNKPKIQLIGSFMAGFGMLFFGLEVISDSVAFFKNFEFFRNIFLVKNHLLLFLNGFIITAIIQSSSAVTSVMIILGLNGLLTFESSMFIILGANVGTCLCVLVASYNKPVEARRAGWFNILFNLTGALVLFIPLSIFSEQVSYAFSCFSGGIERQIANFHTLFNLFVTLILLPILKPFTNLICLFVKDDNQQKPQKVSTKKVKIIKT